MEQNLFPAKVLLFGEYGLMQNGGGLSIPHNFYKGALKFSEHTAQENHSNFELRKYHHFLSELSQKEAFNALLCLDTFYEDLQKGMFFDSNIPQGYGIGSSGALVAAIYDRYAKNKIPSGTELKRNHISSLKIIFSQMESYFHGKSSGIDPLICYFDLPLLIESTKEVYKAHLPRENHQNAKGAIFLIDSGLPSSTSFMIELFLEKISQEGFRNLFKEEFIKYSEACIESFLKADFKPLLKEVKRLSYWVYNHFRPMVPSSLWRIWKDGLLSNDYYLKLCGSGGGGFILGFAADYERVKEKLNPYALEVIFRF